ncbi:hypothetical protein [Pseudomonas anguilliseptica]|uniref:hypothetical protein n=1 Tax=Pseudomonas anguilliseptica TaxID=53406 RepID=UPI001428D75F|nr:hypothetical protein [Pseudomonas anguilliseptica]
MKLIIWIGTGLVKSGSEGSLTFLARVIASKFLGASECIERYSWVEDAPQFTHVSIAGKRSTLRQLIAMQNAAKQIAQEPASMLAHRSLYTSRPTELARKPEFKERPAANNVYAYLYANQ